MSFILNLIEYAFQQVLQTVAANWPFLLASILISAAIKLYADQERVASFLQKNRKGGVLISTIVAVTTPLCSCGTTAPDRGGSPRRGFSRSRRAWSSRTRAGCRSS